MRSLSTVFVIGILASGSFADTSDKLHSTNVDGDTVYGHITIRSFNGIEVGWFKPCPPRNQGYPREDLVLVEEERSDCPNFAAPNRRNRPDPFDGSSPTLSDVKARGRVNCGVSTGVPGFAEVDVSGEWRGFDVAVCRAVAAAVLNDPSAVEFVPTTGKTRFAALASGEVDVLARNTTWTLSRDADLKFEFVGINYFDGQGFVVPRSLGVSSAKELDGATACVQTGTTTELNLSDFFSSNNISYEPVPVENNLEAVQSYLSGACDVYTADVSALAATRSTFEDPSQHLILPEIVSKEPLGPMVRHGDQGWGDIVRWTLNALISAEELGVTSSNVKELAVGTNNPEINRLLGAQGDLGPTLGLESNWAENVIAGVGNYGEIFDSTLGENTPVGLARGLNSQWTEGGLLYSPPFR